MISVFSFLPNCFSPEGVSNSYLYFRIRIWILRFFTGLGTIVFWVSLAHWKVIKRNGKAVLFIAGFLYSVVTLYYYPEVSPIQFLYEQRIARTKFSRGFNIKAFSNVDVGMPKEAVEDSLGSGYSKNKGQSTVWFFSRPAGTANYWQFYIEFDSQGLVKEKRALFFVD